jgi:hypothetical protein
VGAFGRRPAAPQQLIQPEVNATTREGGSVL